jgi:hypothetical protein
MVLGSILKATQKARLWPFPEPPYKGFTVDGLKNDILAIEIKTLCDITNPEHGLNTHKGLPPDRRPRSGFFDDDDNSPPRRPYSPRRPISPPRSPLMSRRLRQANRYEPDDKYRLKASQAIKGSITKTINTLSDKLCGLKIEDFK